MAFISPKNTMEFTEELGLTVRQGLLPPLPHKEFVGHKYP